MMALQEEHIAFTKFCWDVVESIVVSTDLGYYSTSVWNTKSESDSLGWYPESGVASQTQNPLKTPK